MKKTIFLLNALVLIGLSGARAQINVNTSATLTQMISNIVGPGNTVSNVTMNCPSGAYGTFTNGNTTNVGINSGALLTTGSASAVNGTGGSFASVDHLAGGDALLTGIAGATTYDACRIEFDIIPQCSTLQMQYVFGSEEYPEWVNQGYNDAFGFFITGPNPLSGNYTNYNIALVPSTTLPVTIDNINSFTYSQYYIDNQSGTTISYDGLTTPLTASVNVVPCSTYHMIIVIADGGDGIYDSGVFLTYQGLSCPSYQVQVAGNTNICPGDQTTLTASNMTSYTWSPSTGLNTTTGPTVIASPTVTTTYTVTGTTGACNTDTTTITVNVTPAPPVTVSPSPAYVCTGGNVNLTASGAGSYTWSPATGLNTTSGATVTASPVSTTTYTVTGVTGGCTSTSSVVVNVGALTPSAGLDSSVCQGSSLQLSASGGNTYTWSPATGLSNPNIGNPVATPVSTTTYVVTATAGSCSANDTIIVTVTPQPIVSVTPATASVCAGIPTTLTASGAIIYSWSPATGLNAAAGSTVTATPLVTTTYVVTGSANGCSNTDTAIITISPAPDPTITAAGPFCANDAAVTLSAATAGGTWSGTGITNTGSGTFDPVTAGTGNHSIVYSVTAGGCTSTDTIQITVNSIPNSSITPAGPYCVSNPAVTLSAATAGGTWSGPGITNTNTGEFDPAAAGAGTSQVIYTVNNNGCIDDDTLNITVNPLPNAGITSTGPFCANSPAVNLTAATAGGSWSGTGITNTSSGTFSPSTAGPGTYTITYSVTDNNGCSNSATSSITVNANANATITAAGPFCLNAPAVNLTAAQAGGTWSGAGITNTNLGTFNPSAAGSGSHTITYIISGNCGDTGTTTILVAPPPPAPAAPSATYCSNDTMAPLTATATAGGILTWYSNSTLTSPIGTGSPFIPIPGPTTTTSYWVTETVNGCEGPATQVTITINPAPLAAFTATPSTGQIPLTVVLTNNSTGSSGYAWDLGNGSTSIQQNVQTEYTEPGTFVVTLIATSAAGCTDTVHSTIVADAFSMITVPNVFTPNSDGKNDEFKVTYFGISDFHGEIYDRWGLKLFTWHDVSQGWNGITDGGKEASDGTYYYIITASGIDGQSYTFRGFLTLLRK